MAGEVKGRLVGLDAPIGDLVEHPPNELGPARLRRWPFIPSAGQAPCAGQAPVPRWCVHTGLGASDRPQDGVQRRLLKQPISEVADLTVVAIEVALGEPSVPLLQANL